MLLDDKVTLEESILSAANQIRSVGGVVTNCILLIERNDGGAENLSPDLIELHSLCYIDEMADILHHMHMISDFQRARNTKPRNRAARISTSLGLKQFDIDLHPA